MLQTRAKAHRVSLPPFAAPSASSWQAFEFAPLLQTLEFDTLGGAFLFPSGAKLDAFALPAAQVAGNNLLLSVLRGSCDLRHACVPSRYLLLLFDCNVCDVQATMGLRTGTAAQLCLPEGVQAGLGAASEGTLEL
jgi:hypothetical protein